MSTVYSSAGGTRQQRAAQLRQEMEDRMRAAESPEQAASPDEAAVPSKDGAAAYDSYGDDAVVDETPTVGQGDHVVQPGECIASIARQTGHFWETIWKDAANTGLREVRQQPNVLMAGDRVAVPELRPKSDPSESERRHRFRRRGEPSHLAIRVLDHDVPRANQPYTLVIDGKQTITGVTDAEGKLDVPIPGDAKKGVLTVGVAPDTETHDLNLGGLDPVESWQGLQARLRNMGYECQITGVRDDQTMDAVDEFRNKEGLPEGGELDEATRQRVKERHGS